AAGVERAGHHLGQRCRLPDTYQGAPRPVTSDHAQRQRLVVAPGGGAGVPGHVRGQERERAPRLGQVAEPADRAEGGGGRGAHSPAPVACAGAPSATPVPAPAPAPSFASGSASTPASLRWAAVIGAGAPVSG